MASGHFSLDFLDGEVQKSLNIAKILGMDSIYCPHLAAEQRPTDGAGWLAFGKRLQEDEQALQGRRLRVRLAQPRFRVREARRTVRCRSSASSKARPDISWEADIAWVVRGGADPFAWIEKLGSRITSAHVKDIAPAGENKNEDGWADVGHGTLPWAKLDRGAQGHQDQALRRRA